MKELLEYLVKALVDDPNGVKISETEGETVTILEIRVSPDDVGKVIGREGRIANALRTVVKAAGAKHKKKVSVEIMTEGSPNRKDNKEG
ncbi:MAG: KH domain-containing protein [bacterium]